MCRYTDILTASIAKPHDGYYRTRFKATIPTSLILVAYQLLLSPNVDALDIHQLIATRLNSDRLMLLIHFSVSIGAEMWLFPGLEPPPKGSFANFESEVCLI